MPASIRRRAVITAAILVGLYVLIYVVGMFTEPYRTSARFVRDSGVVRREIGEVKSIRLALFGYSARYSGTSGWAEYTLDVVGSRGAGTAYLNLRRDVGLWRVEEGNLALRNGKRVGLSTTP